MNLDLHDRTVKPSRRWQDRAGDPLSPAVGPYVHRAATAVPVWRIDQAVRTRFVRVDVREMDAAEAGARTIAAGGHGPQCSEPAAMAAQDQTGESTT